MLREAFIGRGPTHFQVNPLVKVFLVSEMILWSSYNLFFPILSVFVIRQIDGGTIELAAFGFSVYMLVRVVMEILSGMLLRKSSENKKFLLIFLGLIVLSIAYGIFSLANSTATLFAAYSAMGMGLGIATPARLALFSKHLDKNKEAEEWSIHDATSFIGMALAGALGGLITQKYGFSNLFLLASVLNLLSIIPYISYFRRKEIKKL